MNIDEAMIADAIEVIDAAVEQGLLLNGEQASEVLGSNRSNVARLIKDGLLETVTPHAIGRLITRSSVEGYMKHRDARGLAGAYAEDNQPRRYDNG